MINISRRKLIAGSLAAAASATIGNAPLLAAGIHEVLIAKTPDEPAMFAIVDALAALPKTPLGQDMR